MLGMKKYDRKYIDECRARVHANVSAYEKQVGKTLSREFEARYFNDSSMTKFSCWTSCLCIGSRRGKGWQSAERGSYPVQLALAQSWKVANRETPRLADFCSIFAQTPGREIGSQAQGWRQNRAKPRRFCAAR
jgi:hypothetical protein